MKYLTPRTNTTTLGRDPHKRARLRVWPSIESTKCQDQVIKGTKFDFSICVCPSGDDPRRASRVPQRPKHAILHQNVRNSGKGSCCVFDIKSIMDRSRACRIGLISPFPHYGYEKAGLAIVVRARTVILQRVCHNVQCLMVLSTLLPAILVPARVFPGCGSSRDLDEACL